MITNLHFVLGEHLGSMRFYAPPPMAGGFPVAPPLAQVFCMREGSRKWMRFCECAPLRGLYEVPHCPHLSCEYLVKPTEKSWLVTMNPLYGRLLGIIIIILVYVCL